MIRRVNIAPSSENIHSLVYHSCCMKVSIWGRRSKSIGNKLMKRHYVYLSVANSRVNKAPLHRLEIQTMHITWKLIYHFFKASKNVHTVIDNASWMSVSRSRQTSTNFRRFPFKGFRVEAKQNITHLWKCNLLQMQLQNCITSTYHLVISTTKQVDLIFVCNGRVSYNGFILLAKSMS